MLNPTSWTKLKIPTTGTVCTYYNIITSLTCMWCSLLLSYYSCSFSLIILIMSLFACSPSDFCRTSIGCVRWNSVGLPLALSIGIPSVLVISGGWFVVSPLEKSVGLRGPARNARTSSGKSSEKYYGQKAKKYPFCLPEVRQSPLGVHSEKQWECKDLMMWKPT